MENTTLKTAVSVFLVCLVIVNAAEVQNTIALRYHWEPFTEYRYVYTHELSNETNVISRIDFPISVIGESDGNTILTLNGIGIASNYIQFITVDMFGTPHNRRIFPKKQFDGPREEKGNGFHEVSSAISALTMYNKKMWEIPRDPILLNAKTSIAKEDFRYSIHTNVLVMERVTKQDKNVKAQRLEKRFFDVRAGRLIEVMEQYGRECHLFKLVDEKPLGETAILSFKNQYENSISEDEFRETMFTQYIFSTNQAAKRQAYIQLLQIKEDFRLKRLFRTFIENAEQNTLFRELVSQAFATRIMEGREWAIALFMKMEFTSPEQQDIYENAVAALKNISKLDIGETQEAWQNWHKRVAAVLPDLGETEREKLLISINDKDPWVRLFSLRLLYDRKDADIFMICKNAAKDKDEIVREYAGKILKQLKHP